MPDINSLAYFDNEAGAFPGEAPSSAPGFPNKYHTKFYKNCKRSSLIFQSIGDEEEKFYLQYTLWPVQLMFYDRYLQS